MRNDYTAVVVAVLLLFMGASSQRASAITLARAAATHCCHDPVCSAKFSVQPAENGSCAEGAALGATERVIEDMFASHGLDRHLAAADIVADHLAAARLAAALHLSCERPADAVERAASARHVVSAAVVVAVVVATHIGLFVLWGARASSLARRNPAR
jgi:hypothetical protein